MLPVLFGMVMTSADVMAQNPRFRLTPLVKLGFTPQIEFDSGCVNVTDVFAVITHWGACPIGEFCHWDVNGSCTVDVSDLVAINTAWGCTACLDCTCPSSFVAPSPPSLEEMIALVLDAPISSDAKAEIIEQLIANWS